MKKFVILLCFVSVLVASAVHASHLGMAGRSREKRSWFNDFTTQFVNSPFVNSVMEKTHHISESIRHRYNNMTDTLSKMDWSYHPRVFITENNVTSAVLT